MKINFKQLKLFLYTLFLAFIVNLQALERPDVINTKVENPKSVVFIGNSFFITTTEYINQPWAWSRPIKI